MAHRYEHHKSRRSDCRSRRLTQLYHMGQRTEKARTEKWKRSGNVAHFHSVTFTGSQTGHPLCLSGGQRRYLEFLVSVSHGFCRIRTISPLFTSAIPKIICSPCGPALSGPRFWTRPMPTFLLYAGDLVNHANMDSEWHEWFEAGGWIHAKIPSIPSPGNHEYSERSGCERTQPLHSMASAFHPARKWPRRLCRNDLLRRLSGRAHHLAQFK